MDRVNQESKNKCLVLLLEQNHFCPGQNENCSGQNIFFPGQKILSKARNILQRTFFILAWTKTFLSR